MTQDVGDLIERIEGSAGLDRLSKPIATGVQRLTRSDAVENALSGTWLGHPLHPLLTDLPIGAWAMASALDVTAGTRGAAAARRLVGLGVLAAVPTAASGASDWSTTYAGTQRVGLMHALANATATTMQAASWVARGRGQRWTGAALSGLALGITASAAYLGGHLTLVRGVGVNNTAFQSHVTDWTDVAALSDLADGEPTLVSAGGVPVVLVHVDGRLQALSATCVHAGGPLDKGEIVGDDCIRCPWHGSTFRLADGGVVRGPASVAEPTWETKVEDARVHVRSSGDSAG